MTALDEIWEGDKLGRRKEAMQLQRFLDSEARSRVDMGRTDAFVLALDAEYGQGKSWFLDRLRQQLDLNYPVAFVDAWVDDANNEPLVSIMAAIDDAMQPLLADTAIEDKMAAVMLSALPIMGKAVLSAGGKFLGKYLGDTFAGDAKEIYAGATAAKPDKNDPVGTGVDKVADGIAQIVDAAGKSLLEGYRARQRSRATFKANLRALAKSIEDRTDVSKHGPIFVIIDELDRCRPSYAISLLEEIKHLFDVPGVVFVIALHGDQLEHSIKAVYGEGFNAKSYLRRFFSRRYELRHLSISELVATHFETMPSGVKFSSPRVWNGNGSEEAVPSKVAGALLSEWGTTPREAIAIVDALRLFASNWDYREIPIELPMLLAMLFNFLNEKPTIFMPEFKRPQEIWFSWYGVNIGDTRQDLNKVSQRELGNIYNMGTSTGMFDIMRGNWSGVTMYLQEVANNEYRVRFPGQPVSPGMQFSWMEYGDRITELSRFLERDESEPA